MEADNDVEMHVKVTNLNDFDIEDRFDGVPYVFHKQEGASVKLGKHRSLVLPPDAARHILGAWNGASKQQMFMHATRRWGYANPKDPKALEMWKNLKIEPVAMRMVEVPFAQLKQEEPAAA